MAIDEWKPFANNSPNSIISNTPPSPDPIMPLSVINQINDSNKSITSTTPPNFNRNITDNNNSNDTTEIIDTHTNTNTNTNTHFHETSQIFEQNKELFHATIDPTNSLQAIVKDTKKYINPKSVYYELPVLCDGNITKSV